MKLWLLALAIAAGLFVAANALLFRQPSAAPILPQAIELTSINGEGAALTQTIHQRSTIDRLSLDLGQLMPERRPSQCRPGNSGQYRAVFRYGAGRATTITADKGCEHILVSGPGWDRTISWSGPALVRDFDALFPPSWQTGV